MFVLRATIAKTMRMIVVEARKTPNAVRGIVDILSCEEGTCVLVGDGLVNSFVVDLSTLHRGASPLGLPYTRPRSPLRRLAPAAWLARALARDVAFAGLDMIRVTRGRHEHPPDRGPLRAIGCD